MNIFKPQKSDLPDIKDILYKWTDKEEADKYIDRILSEIDGDTEWNMRYWVIKQDDKVYGVSGIGDSYPKLSQHAKTNKPGLIKIMYLVDDERGKGIGKLLLKAMEEEMRKFGYSEIIVGSHSQYKDTAFGFYKKMGYKVIGRNKGDSESDYMEVFGKVLLEK